MHSLLKVTGDWQKFKGLPGAEGTLRVAEPKRDKQEIFNEALAEAHGSLKTEAVTAKKTAKKAEKKDDAAEAPKADEAKAEEPKADEAAAETTEA